MTQQLGNITAMRENKGNTVVSVCDGMSCGQIALRELGISVAKYYASEIDKFAIAQTQLNFPDTIQLGDIRGWRDWNIDWSSVNLVLAGTPCTGFSFAGKGLAFDDPQSRLFFVFVEILNHIKKLNPDVKFLLENVNMKKEYLRIISEMVGVFPVRINSALVSAQNRDRYYWSNIRVKQVGLFGELHTDIPQPEDRGILLGDILEDEVDEKYYLSEKIIRGFANKKSVFKERFIPKNPDDKSACLTSRYHKMASTDTFIKINKKGHKKSNQHKASCLTAGAHSGGNHSDMGLIIQLNPSTESGGTQPYQQNRVYSTEGKSPAHMAQMSCGSYAIQENRAAQNLYKDNSQGGRIYSGHRDKSATLTGGGAKTGLYNIGYRIRRLTPLECSRLQTIPEWYRWACSDTQVYRMTGNGWNILTITHILQYYEFKNK
jgi:DNA-methyltransferase (dcm)